MKYEYMLLVWGGFFNKEFQDIHKIEEGYYYFDTAEERETFVKKLRSIEEDLGAWYLMTLTQEGYHLRKDVILHRVTRFEGKDYHTSTEQIRGCSFETAKYHMENKWYLGFNDYPLGEDFDYDSDKVEVIAEWIEGCFDIGEEEY